MQRITDPLSFFKYHQSGPEALRLFQAGAVLYQSEPGSLSSREWLRNADGTEFPANGSDLEAADWLVKFATPTEVTPAVKKQYPANGNLRAWVINHDKLALQTVLWQRAEVCAADWNACAGTFSGNLAGLSKKALSLLKLGWRGKRYADVDMEPEHLNELIELNKAGLLTVQPEGTARVKVPAWQLGPLLQKARLAARMQDSPHVFVLPWPEFPTFDPLDGLTHPEGKKVLDAYIKGATLNIWRWTSPHNRWLEKRGKEVYLWTHDRDCEQYNNQPSSYSLVAIGRCVAKEGTIPYCGFGTHRDGGMAGKEIWAFDQERFDKAVSLWESAQNASARWNTAIGTFKGDLSGLSPMALAALRYLAKNVSVAMNPELFPVLKELSAAGLISVQPEGFAYLVEAARGIRVPKGPMLKIVRLKVDSNKPHPVTGKRVERHTDHWHTLPAPAGEEQPLAKAA